MAHPARLAIIELLASQKTCNSGDIAAKLPLARTTASQHPQELKALGPIRGEIDGLTVGYCLNTELLRPVQQQFTAFFGAATAAARCGWLMLALDYECFAYLAKMENQFCSSGVRLPKQLCLL